MQSEKQQENIDYTLVESKIFNGGVWSEVKEEGTFSFLLFVVTVAFRCLFHVAMCRLQFATTD